MTDGGSSGDPTLFQTFAFDQKLGGHPTMGLARNPAQECTYNHSGRK